jgi:NAD(P)-dependent dehydrogenase (short-subunit alcohol dehydrogenase family)
MSVVLITGANGNLGRATVKCFSDGGWKVVAIASPRASNHLFKDLPLVDLIKVNADSEQEVFKTTNKVIDQYGEINAAVLTIGGYTAGSITETTSAGIQMSMQLNFFTAWYFAKPLFVQMLKQQNGHLVLIGSKAGIIPAEGTYAIGYSIAKAAVAKLAALLEAAGKNRNVYCHLVSPSTMDTPQNRALMPDADFSRWQKPESVATEIFKKINR